MQAMEKRYQILIKKHDSVVASKEALEKENMVLQTNVKDARQESHSFQSSLMKAESEKEQLKLEVDSLERDKVSVRGAYEESKKEITELQGKVQSLSSKILLITKENGSLDAKIQHILSERSRESLNYSKLEQEKSILEKSNAWFQDELERKAQMSNEERQKATQKIVELSNQCCEYKSRLENLETDHERLKLEISDQNERLKNTSKLLKEARESFAEKQESFEQELTLAQRMAQLYRESSEENAKRTMELEGIVSELKVHLEESSAAYSQTVAELEQQCKEATEKAQEEKEIREKVVAAAAAGSFGISAPSKEDPSNEEQQNHITSAEMYAKLIEAEERLRVEQLKTREKEIYFEDLLIEVEKRASLLHEQQVEFEKIKSSHVKLLADINELSVEKKSIYENLKKMESRAKDLSNEKVSLEQQVRDLGQQVAKLLHATTNPNSKDSHGFAGGNATDVTTEYLVEFSTIEELQQQNQKLLKVNRELSMAAETTKEEVKREMQEEYEARIDQLRSDLDDVKRNREHAEEIFEHVVRQRDTLRELLQGVGGDLGAGRRRVPNEKSLGSQESLSVSCLPNNLNTARNPENLQYREMYDDLEKKFDEYKKKSTEEYSNLEKDLSSAKNELISMKRQISQAQAECEYEKERCSRLSASTDSQQMQVENLLASNAKYQALVNELERRLSVAQQNLSDSEEKLRCLNNQVSILESEKKILAEAEKRLTKEASGLSQEKFRLAAELDVLRKQFNQLESETSVKMSRQQESILKLENDLSSAKREVSIARGRVEYAHTEVAQLKEELKNTASKLESKLDAKATELSEMQRRASSAEAKSDLLQEAIRKSEEKVARLEIEKNARISAPQNASLFEAEAEQSQDVRGNNINRVKEYEVEIKVLREELVSAQEALAASTGHAKQYETIAQTAEEALKSSQTEHQKFKRDAANRVSSIETEVKRLRVEISKKDISIKELKQEESKLRQECERFRHMVDVEKANAKEQVRETYQNLETEKQRVSDLTREVEKLGKEITEVRKAYDAEVVAHGDAVKRIASTESSLETIQNRLKSVLNDLDNERASKKKIEAEHVSKIEEQNHHIQNLQRSLEQISNFRDTLQQELESLTKSSGPDVSQLSNSMKLLRQEREAAELNLSLCEREVIRLRQENSVAKRAVEEARAQLSAEMERQNLKRTENKESEINYKEQISITRESNIALRSDNMEKQKQLKVFEEQLKQCQSIIDPLNLQIKEKESEVASLKEELKVALESANRWESRSKALSEKSGSINAEEYEQLKSDLDQAKHDLGLHQEKSSTLLKEKGDLENRLKQAETIAHRTNASVNALKKQLEEQKKKSEASCKSVSDLSRKQQEEKDKKIQEITDEKMALESKILELTKKEETWKLKAKNLLSNCEKSNLAKKQAESQVKSLKYTLENLQKEISLIKAPTERDNQECIPIEGGLTEPSGKRKTIEQKEEISNKKLRPAAEVFTPAHVEVAAEQQHVAPNPITTGRDIVDLAIKKAIRKTETPAQDMEIDPEVVIKEKLDENVQDLLDTGKSHPGSEDSSEKRQRSENEDTAATEEKNEGDLEYKDGSMPSRALEEGEDQVQKQTTEEPDIEENDIGENEIDVDPSHDVLREDAKQTDEGTSKPDSPKKKTKRTKIQWKDTSK